MSHDDVAEMRSASTPDEVDLVLVGGGAGSLVAGLAAADAGLSVALLERVTA